MERFCCFFKTFVKESDESIIADTGEKILSLLYIDSTENSSNGSHSKIVCKSGSKKL